MHNPPQLYDCSRTPGLSTFHAAMDYSEWNIAQFNWAGRIFNSTAEVLEWFKANNNTSAGYKIREMATPQEKMFSTYEVRNKTTRRGMVPGATLYEPNGKRCVHEAALGLCTAQRSTPCTAL